MRAQQRCNNRCHTHNHHYRASDSMPNIHIHNNDDHSPDFQYAEHNRGDFNHFVPPNLHDFIPDDFLPNVVPIQRTVLGTYLDYLTKITLVVINAIMIIFMLVFIYTTISDRYPDWSFSDLIPQFSQEITKEIVHEDSRDTELKQIQEKLDSLQQNFDLLTKNIDSAIVSRNEIDHISAQHINKIENKIQEAIDLYDTDKVGMIDYALESSGATIHSIPDTHPYPSRIVYSILAGLVTITPDSNPRLLLQPGVQPGQCFAYHGSWGRVRIRLARTVRVQAVTMDHADPRLVEDESSAPREFIVSGLESGDGHLQIELGRFIMKLNGKPQTFQIEKPQVFRFIELSILNNYGKAEFTCVYRFRVHGQPE